MDTLPSAQFRKVYATLTTPTRVTVNGHVIGTYTPISSAIDVRYVEAIRPGEPTSQPVSVSFNPAPKPSARKASK